MLARSLLSDTNDHSYLPSTEASFDAVTLWKDDVLRTRRDLTRRNRGFVRRP
jgi:hypothetical protein